MMKGEPMPQSEYRARQVRAKTNEVVEYTRNDELPGKPLFLLIPGGLIALATLSLIIYIVYRTWFEGTMGQDLGTTLVAVLAPFYVGGVFLFSYGYELYNLPRALRLTAIIVFVTLAAVVIVAVLVVVAGGASKSGSRSSSKSSSTSSSSRSSNSKGDWLAGGIGAAASSKSSGSKGSSTSAGSGSQSSNWGSSGGHIYGGNVFLGGNSTRVETREVTKEVIKEVPKEPMPITCPFCATSYIPVEHKYICPSCGAATPKELIEESQMPKDDK